MDVSVSLFRYLFIIYFQEKITFKSPHEERNARGNSSSNAVCLIQDNLRMDTMYYFSVRAYNSAGESEMSQIVNCRTLSSMDQNIPGMILCIWHVKK